MGVVGESAEQQAPVVDADAVLMASLFDHRRLLAVLAVREVGSAEAEDVVQETLLRAWRRRSTYDATRGSLKGWLVAILLDQARRHRTRRTRDLLMDETPVGGPDVERIATERAIAALPRRQREVVTLYYLADLSVAELAAVLGISEGTAKSTLSDARRALQHLLEPS